MIPLDGTQMGITKNSYWKFQDEVRYRIITYIREMDLEIRTCGNESMIEEIIDKYADRLPPYIDLYLSNRAINSMK